MLQSDLLRANGRIDEARQVLDRASQLQGNGFIVDLARGNIELQASHPADALPWYEKALATRPDSREARVQYAKSLRRAGRLPEAAQQYAALATRFPRDVEVLVNRGELLLASGQVDAAEQDFKTALEIDPRRKEALYNLGVVALRRGDPQTATRAASAALAADPRYAEAYMLLGNASAQTHDFGAAVRAFEQAVALDSSMVQARVNLGAARLDAGNYAGAIAVLESVVRDNPSPNAWINLANAQSRAGSGDAAEASFRNALQLEPNSEPARRGLGLLLAGRGGRGAEARQWLEPLAAAHPGDEEIAAALARARKH